jgi:hypothetical protein
VQAQHTLSASAREIARCRLETMPSLRRETQALCPATMCSLTLPRDHLQVRACRVRVGWSFFGRSVVVVVVVVVAGTSRLSSGCSNVYVRVGSCSVCLGQLKLWVG